MAAPLFTVRSDIGMSEERIESKQVRHRTLDLNLDTRDTLLCTFHSSPLVYPILFLSEEDDEMVPKLLERILKEAEPLPDSNYQINDFDIQNFCYGTPGVSEGKVIVWINPVSICGHHLLLIRLKNFTSRIAGLQESEAFRKCLFCLLGIVSFCVVSCSSHTTDAGLMFAQHVYKDLKASTGLKIAKFLSLNKIKPSQSERTYMSDSLSRYTKFLEKSQWKTAKRLFSDLIDDAETSKFLESHSLKVVNQEGSSAVSSLINILRITAGIANMNFDYRTFILKVPRIISEDFKEKIEILERQAQEQIRIQTAAALPFIVRTAKNRCNLDQSLLKSLQATFDRLKPTVVLVLLGNQGIGKSTFMNKIVQHCIGSARAAEYFLARNSALRTTQDSQMLSHPLYLPGSESQLMLVDVEGLRGFDVEDQETAILQRNLIWSLLTVTSVLCVYVNNETLIRGPVESYIEKLVFCAKNFGLLIERVNFLLHDKDFIPEGQSENIHIISWVNRLNEQYFDGRSIIKLIHKPNFIDVRNTEMIEKFMSYFLTQIDFPKRNISGSNLNVSELLTHIDYICQHSNSNLQELSFSFEEQNRLSDVLQEKTQEMDSLFASVTSDGEVSLVAQFNESVRNLTMKLPERTPREMKYIGIRIEKMAQSFRLKLTSIENSYKIVSRMNDEDLRAMIDSLLTRFDQESWWYPTFIKQADSFHSILRETVDKYPRSTAAVVRALNYIDSLWTLKKKLYIGKYCINVSLGMLAAPITVPCSCRPAMNAKPNSWCVARELLGFDLQPESWNNEVVSWNDVINSNTIVLLVLAHRGTRVSTVLDELVLKLHPFTIVINTAFSPLKRAQMLYLEYPGRRETCMIIFLTLPSEGEDAITAISKVLFPRVSVACVFAPNDIPLLEELVNTIYPLQEPHSAHVPHIALYLSNSCSEQFTQKIGAKLSQRVPFILQSLNAPVENVSQEILMTLIECIEHARAVSFDEYASMFEKAKRCLASSQNVRTS